MLKKFENQSGGGGGTAARGTGGFGGGGGGAGRSGGGSGGGGTGSAAARAMLCCGGDKDARQDLKSAQNTPSRQPLNNPNAAMGPGGVTGGAYPGAMGQQPGMMQPQQPPKGMMGGGPMGMGGMAGPGGPGLGPPPLTQVGRMQQPQPGPGGGGMNSFDMRMDEVKKVSKAHYSTRREAINNNAKHRS